MTILTLNGIAISSIVATADVKGERRDVGDVGEAVDGTTRITRQTRKYDLGFKSVPLVVGASFSWEQLLIGAGDVWSFDAHVYSSKGWPGSPTSGSISISTSVKKYGAASLLIATGSSWSTTGLGLAAPYTVATWNLIDSGDWTHYVLRSDGAKWVDGVRNDGANFSTIFSISSGDVVLAGSGSIGSAFDDLVVCPYLWQDSWPAAVHAADAAFGPTPFVDLRGDLIPEQGSRRAYGQVKATTVKTATGPRDILDVDLKAK
jgi:hypothetical protein